ncbi:5'-nucleotidase C-terminal domain-containing protein [Bacillus sp. AGMB 02131]|uniref:5'-nucleotidase C-terminal domain-containing protein n=2 Tax=Peribacillus faecalis TaxID=2772559 RepID=A0A927CVX2_9BACI|nr:5'-nucleotidase C-terminal domain-containing protein [Peribacillus faecalis]
MHTNDTHANLDNVAKRVTAVKEVRAKKPDSLLLDAGDVFSGTLYFNEFKGQADLQFMNLMKYDLMTMGNHEFDLGSSPEGHTALADFVKKSKFSFVSTNVNYSKDPHLKKLFSNEITSKPKSGKIYNGVIKTINGEKVGFFGLTTEETKDISSPVNITFSNYIDEANEAVKAFEKLGVNKIVAITHIGYDDNPAYDNDLTLAKEVDGIDIIVGGHSHTQLDQPVVIDEDENGATKDPTVIVQAYQYNEFLGTLDVEFDKKGKIVGHAGELIKIADKTADPEAEALLKPYKDKIDEIKNTPTEGVAAKPLTSPRDGGDVTKPSVRKNETELGNLITDGMLDKAKDFNPNTVMAFQNGGGIRADINEGPITLGEILTVLPFGNTLATMELTGAEIKEALEHSVRLAPAENGGFLHVSGMKFIYDSTKPAGNRVQTMEVKNADGSYSAILPEQKYVIATNAFTAKGGDGFTVFQKAYNEGRVTDIGLADWENLRDYVNKLKDVNPQIEGRIKDAASKTVDASDFSGTEEAPKMYNGNIVVDVSNITALKHAVIKGDLKLTGTVTDAFTFSNLKIEGDFDISEVNGSIFNFTGIEVGGETIF